MIEHKSFDVEWKGLGDDAGSVELYAAVFNNIDRANERIRPGAFKNLDEFVREGWLAVNHDWGRLPVATVDHAEQDSKGLLVKAHFHSTPEAQAVRTVIRERVGRGKSVPASIGYRVLEDEDVKVEGKSIRDLAGIHVHEASIVNLGCNAQAGVFGAKSLMTIDELRGLIAEYKAGRMLSSSNRGTVRGWRGNLAAILSEIDALLDAAEPPDPQRSLDPTTQPSIPKSLLPELIDLNREFLATTARFNR